MTRAVLALLLAPLCACVATKSEYLEGDPVQSEQAFELLKSLAGKWRSTGLHPDLQDAVELTYEVVSGGTAVMERLSPGTEHEMISIYHRDGPGLAMTHYCSEGNQPRMVLAGFSAAPEPTASFTFQDATNWKGPEQLVIHDVRICRISDDTIAATWSAWVGGKPDHAATFEFKRVP